MEGSYTVSDLSVVATGEDVHQRRDDEDDDDNDGVQRPSMTWIDSGLGVSVMVADNKELPLFNEDDADLDALREILERRRTAVRGLFCAGFGVDDDVRSFVEITAEFVEVLRLVDVRAASMENLAAAVQGCLQLKRLDLNRNMFGAEAAPAFATAVRAHSSRLTTLRLGKNALGVVGATVLAPVIAACSALETLDLHCNELGDVGTAVLAQALVGARDTLTSLDLHRNRIGVAGATALAAVLSACSKLVALDISNNRIKSAGATALGPAFAACSALKRLNLRRNKLGDAGAATLCSAVQACSKLTSLDIGKNDLRAASAASLASVLQACKRLEELDLRRNRLGDAGAKSLSAAVAACSRLKLLVLDLSHNQLGDEGARALLASIARACPSLRDLHLTNNELGDAFASELWLTIQASSKLEMLYLGGNSISDASAEALRRLMLNPNRLVYLWLQNNRLTQVGARVLLGAAPFCPTVKKLATSAVGSFPLNAELELALNAAPRNLGYVEALALFGGALGVDDAADRERRNPARRFVDSCGDFGVLTRVVRMLVGD